MVLLLALLGPWSVRAQEPLACGAGHGAPRPTAEFLDLLRHQAAQRGGDTLITIPVVFHVLHQRGAENIANGHIFDALGRINEDFNAQNSDLADVIPQFQDIVGNARVEFKLATKDPDGNCTSGIVRKRTIQTLLGRSTSYEDQWPRDRYMNVWVVRSFSAGGSPAYTPYPEETQGTLSVRDGTMIMHSYVWGTGTMLSAIRAHLTHQVGHFLGLRHPFGDAIMGVECGDDGIDDTPITRGFWFCPPTPEASQVCAAGVYENYQNFLEASYCQRMFTAGQCDWMRATLSSPLAGRNNLGTAQNLALTGTTPESAVVCAPEADFYAVVGNDLLNPAVPFNPTTCVDQNVRFVDNSSRTFPTQWAWTFQDGDPASSNEQHPIVSFQSPGWKTVTLTATNDQGSTTKVDTMAVLVGYASVAMPYGNEDFEDTTVLAPWITDNHDEDHTQWELYAGGGCTGSACAWLNSGDRDALDTIDPTNDNDLDDLVSPLMDLTDLDMGRLSFCWAYGSQTSDPDSMMERLEIYISGNCGASWQLRGAINGPDLVTQTSTEVPENWSEHEVSLMGSLSSSATARFRFRFISGHGSGHLFLDNIGVSSTVGLEEPGTDGTFFITPNPVRGPFTVRRASGGATDLEILDLQGKRVFGTTLPGGSPTMHLDTDAIGLQAGIYLVRVSGSTAVQCTKLLVH